jgi:aryl-alcohol dehydrogenase-like predicted oxidoreductase
MERRELGKTGMQVSVLALGAADIGFKNLPLNKVERLLREAMDLGVNVIDTAECYGDSEEKIGRATPARRQYYIFTKCGHASGLDAPDWSPRLLEQSIERSLRRLRTDYLDVVQLHSCSEQVLRQSDVIHVLQRAKQAGKTRYLGYSGDGQNAVYAIRLGVFDTLQTSINLADQEAIDVSLPLAKERGMGVIVKRPLARVAWTLPKRIGRATRALLRRLLWVIPPLRGHPSGRLNDTYLARFDHLDYEFLRKGGTEAVETALRFTLSVDGVHSAIVGSLKPERWRQNAGIVAAGPLNKDMFEAIRTRWRTAARPEWTEH